MSKLEFRELVELFTISRLQCASSQSVCSVSVHFAHVWNCITFGIALLDYTSVSTSDVSDKVVKLGLGTKMKVM